MGTGFSMSAFISWMQRSWSSVSSKPKRSSNSACQGESGGKA